MTESGVQNLFSKGFPTNRIPVVIPSTGQYIILRETTIVELKSICKTIIDNLNRRQLDVIYDAVTEYLQSMVLEGDVDIKDLTEFDRLFCLMVFFQMSFYKDPINYKCPHCGVEIVYRYDMSKYLGKMGEENTYVSDQKVSIDNKSKTYTFDIGWPSVKTMSLLMRHFYSDMGNITEEMERTQFGINFVMSFVKSIRVTNSLNPNDDFSISLLEIDDFKDRLECLNSLPSLVVFDESDGLFSKITGYFINRLENCFSSELCPQCHKDTYYGLPQSSMFYGLLYGSLRSIYGFILQVECLLVYRYGCGLFDKEQYMTYNDLNTLIHQIGVTAEKENDDRKKMNKDNFTKGLWYIREILNTMIFPEDRKHS